ncbi:MAG: 50S ribosomal protein L15 [Peptococcaceae bacterium]|jgi:large subunit ribosomal protein L15|nr:50S ribosomal protein L15 [Peptococcaceae bacterium]
MKLSELKPAPGSRHAKKRLGRGIGSGLGKTAGKGHKGQKARSGGGKGPYFEGGQTPLQRRMPKRGFTNIFKKIYAEINLETLEAKFEAEDAVTPATLVERGIVKNIRDGVRILGRGEITKILHVQAQGFSKTAGEKIKAAGGTIEVI